MNRLAGYSVAVCAAVGIAACTPDATGVEDRSQMGGPLPALAAAPSAATLHGPRSVKGYVEGSDEYGDACGAGQGVLITSTGTGNVSHFGNAVMVSTTCVNVTDFSTIGSAPYSLKAADGDEAGGFVTGVIFTSDGFDLETSITWGTGRFEGATGALVFSTQSTFTGTWTSTVEGWITY
jgi:hypothetical protein